jgi:hypothetical protein
MKMKKHILLALLSLLAVNFAQAQTKHTTMVESTRDILYPEIVIENGGGHYEHFQHPATDLRCIAWGGFCTLQQYSQYLWEVDSCFLPDGGDLTSGWLFCSFDHPGYIKVTVWDNYGNSGTDSIWFNIKDWVTPMEGFQMEIDNTGHAVFSGVATSEHDRVIIDRAIDTINWHNVYDRPLTPGPWSWRDDNAHFGQDTVWNYLPKIGDTCDIALYPKLTPGLVMGTQPAPGGGWYLTMKSVMQSNKKELEGRDGEEYVYALYTVDHEGVRHPFEVDGEQVVLPTSTQAYLLPGRHPDAYYQGGIGKLTAGKDGGMEVLSYSNKVENPLPDLDDVGDLSGDGTNATGLKVWPNPNNGTFTVEGEGRLKVFNLLGQAIIDRDIDGKLTLTLPSGMYLVRLVNGTTSKTRKVVVE